MKNKTTKTNNSSSVPSTSYVEEPLYSRLQESLRARIHDGEWGPGDKLPSEALLSKEHGVSRITVRHALDNLKKDGLIAGRSGLGTFVGWPALNRGPVPLYHKLKDLIREKIEGGEWLPGYQLPSEMELASEYGVSRVTVRQATLLLAQEGLVERKPGLGTFVGRPKVGHNLQSILIGTGVVPSGVFTFTMHGMELLKPPVLVAKRLGIDRNENVYKLRRTMHVDNEPIIVTTNWFPAARFKGFEGKDLESRPIYDVLVHDYGLRVGHQRKEIELAMVNEEDATLLQTHSGSPALLVTYVSEADEGWVFEFREMVVRGDRCRYFVDLEAPESVF